MLQQPQKTELPSRRQDRLWNSESLSGLSYIFSTQVCNAQLQQKFLFQFYLFQLAGNFGHCLLFGPDGSSQCFLQVAEDKAFHPHAEGQKARHF